MKMPTNGGGGGATYLSDGSDDLVEAALLLRGRVQLTVQLEDKRRLAWLSASTEKPILHSHVCPSMRHPWVHAHSQA